MLSWKSWRQVLGNNKVSVTSLAFKNLKNQKNLKLFQTICILLWKENFMHCMHHLLFLFAFVCSKDWNIIFQFKIYLIKLYVGVYILPNKIFCYLPNLNYCIVWFCLFEIWFVIGCSNILNMAFLLFWLATKVFV